MTDRHKILKIMVQAAEEEDQGDYILMMDTAIRRLAEHGYEITKNDQTTRPLEPEEIEPDPRDDLY